MSKFAFPGFDPEGANVTWSYYIEIISHHMGNPLMIIFASTFFYYIFKKDQINWIVLSCALFPIVVFTFVDNKGLRYTMPTLPAMALVAAVVLTQVKNISARKLL